MLTTAWIPSFFLCWFDWKTGRDCLYETRRSIVPVQCSWFLYSRVCIFRTIARAHCMAHRHTSRPTGCHVTLYTRLLAWMEVGLAGKRGSYGGQIAVAFARNRCEIYLLFDGVAKKVRGLNWLSVGRGRVVWKITSIQSVCYIIHKINNNYELSHKLNNLKLSLFSRYLNIFRQILTLLACFIHLLFKKVLIFNKNVEIILV